MLRWSFRRLFLRVHKIVGVGGVLREVQDLLSGQADGVVQFVDSENNRVAHIQGRPRGCAGPPSDTTPLNIWDLH
ncbi:unnamed protein product [Linum trigynum]|uniref:Uncharacterized protein n=1 Tax=Linum trigynum TaxID=586398 RepID=A0AAV2DEA0_9ROSI